MRRGSAIALFVVCFCYTWTPAFSFFSKAELQSYNVFVKPYGLDLITVISKLSPSIRSCIEGHTDLRTCNNASLGLSWNTSRSELAQMFKECPSGQLGCFQSRANSSSPLQDVLNRLMTGMKRMCSDQCWRKLASVTRSCSRQNTTVIKEAEQNALKFFSEVLNATCFTTNAKGTTCADKLIHGVLDIKKMGDPSHKVCNVSDNLGDEKNICKSDCYEELQQFNKNLGCCVGSVSSMIKCYNITISEDSFGAFVMEHHALCHLNLPEPCKETLCQNGVPATTSPTTHVLIQTSSKVTTSSHNPATKIAGICVASLVVVVGLIILGRFIYQRIKKKEKLHLEDYGYSRLKMLEDDLYNDFTDDSDFEGFVTM